MGSWCSLRRGVDGPRLPQQTVDENMGGLLRSWEALDKENCQHDCKNAKQECEYLEGGDVAYLCRGKGKIDPIVLDGPTCEIGLNGGGGQRSGETWTSRASSSLITKRASIAFAGEA